MFALCALSTTPAAAAPISLGSFSFDSNEFGNTLSQSDGGTFANVNFLNVINANPGSPGFLTGANFNTGIANIPGAPVYTIGYNTSITNGPGADFGVVTARFSTNDTITLTINGQTHSFGPGLAVSTGVPESYFFQGGGPFGATLFVTSIDLSDFGVATGAAISSIAVTGSPELDLIRVAGFAASTAAVPLPAALPLFASGLGAIGLLRWRRTRKAA